MMPPTCRTLSFIVSTLFFSSLVLPRSERMHVPFSFPKTPDLPLSFKTCLLPQRKVERLFFLFSRAPLVMVWNLIRNEASRPPSPVGTTFCDTLLRCSHFSAAASPSPLSCNYGLSQTWLLFPEGNFHENTPPSLSIIRSSKLLLVRCPV